MKTLGVTKELRDDIRRVSSDKESVDACLNRLLDKHEACMDENVSFISRTNINVGEDTYQRLLDCRVYPDEKLTRVIRRLVKLELEVFEYEN